MPKTDAGFNPLLYSTVADRVSLFYRRYPTGRIATELVSIRDGVITFKAMVFREGADPQPAATGWASEREGDGDINTVACLENTETSAVGRALANLGFAASTYRPSREEMLKANRRRDTLQSKAPDESNSATTIQGQADAVLDLMQLLLKAEREGFSPRRMDSIRRRALHDRELPLARVERLEARVRAWLGRKEL